MRRVLGVFQLFDGKAYCSGQTSSTIHSTDSLTSIRQGMIRPIFLRGLCALASVGALAATTSALEILDVTTLTKYLDPLPNPLDRIATPTGTLDGVPLYDVGISQFQQQLHSQLAPTTLWGYNGMYPGPTFDVQRGEPIKVRWTNNLVDDLGMPLRHFLPYDPTLHGADYPGAHEGHHGNHGGFSDFPQARVVTHLHGGVVNEASDGYPEHWFTPDPNAAPNDLGGPAGNSHVTDYPNDQPAANLWYHDHAMGITRLNVYAGMAGFYLIRDAEEAALNLPSGKYEVPLAIQDRSFYENGQLYYPGGDPLDPTAPGTHVSSFYGDANLVNGKLWPYLEVEPRKYRFRLLNGANTRSYNLSIVPDAGAASSDPVTLHQIGTDSGLLPRTFDRSSIFMMSADRADVIVDFSQFNVGDTLRMMNNALNATEGATDEVMQFRIVPPAGADTSSLPEELVPLERYRPEDAVVTRKLQLTRSFDDEGVLRLTLDGKSWDDPVSEIVRLGDLEIWEIANRTGEPHPIHLHLEAFQLLSRTWNNGTAIPLDESELGWEDTVAMYNGQVTRIMVKYDKYAGQFVWHCHLLEHEDHEMMRPFRVIPEPDTLLLALAWWPVATRQRRTAMFRTERS